ncbi:hydrolase [Streptomyces phage Henoccus]|nr:hydrolase [Streptomyces phage Henoccus]
MHARTITGAGALAVVCLLGVAVSPADAAASTTLRTKAYEVAKAQLGDRYVWGATGPSSFDCSGLTWYAYRQAGHTWARKTAHEQRRTQTVDITAAQRTRGDLIFFRPKGKSVYTHVGMYSGDGKMINAVNGSTYKGVVNRPVKDGYWDRYYVADYRRVA